MKVVGEKEEEGLQHSPAFGHQFCVRTLAGEEGTAIGLAGGRGGEWLYISDQSYSDSHTLIPHIDEKLQRSPN